MTKKVQVLCNLQILFLFFNCQTPDIEEFLNKNGLKGIYILPGLVYFVKEK